MRGRPTGSFQHCRHHRLHGKRPTRQSGQPHCSRARQRIRPQRAGPTRRPTLCAVYLAYQQPVEYNLAVAREVLQHVYTAKRLQPPTLLGTVFGTYRTLWARMHAWLLA